MLLPWQWGANFCIGCRADTKTVSGFRCHQQAILNKLLHQFAHEAVGKIMLAFFITEPVYRELLSDI